jgi:small subunit ribosomal protein S3Ae
MAKSVIQKDWYELVAPDIFDNEVVAETPADKERKVDNRTVKVNLKDVMPASDKYYMDVYLQVKNIDGKKAKTELVGHDTSKEYISKMVRRHTDRIDHVVDVETKDDQRVRVKLVGTTIKNTHSSAKTDIRKRMEEIVEDHASKKDFDDFMRDIFQNEIQNEINEECKKIYPLRTIEFRKTERLD